jgi:hypothetical protein
MGFCRQRASSHIASHLNSECSVGGQRGEGGGGSWAIASCVFLVSWFPVKAKGIMCRRFWHSAERCFHFGLPLPVCRQVMFFSLANLWERPEGAQSSNPSRRSSPAHDDPAPLLLPALRSCVLALQGSCRHPSGGPGPGPGQAGAGWKRPRRPLCRPRSMLRTGASGASAPIPQRPPSQPPHQHWQRLWKRRWSIANSSRRAGMAPSPIQHPPIINSGLCYFIPPSFVSSTQP